MDINKLNGRPLRLLIGGSPCTKWSICQKYDRETVNEGEGWELFLNYAIAKEKFCPDIFLYENNDSISNDIKTEISKVLGVPIQMINAAPVSAQQRKRIWVHNIDDVQIPDDLGLVVSDILSDDIVEIDGVYYVDSFPVKLEEIDSYYWKGGVGKDNEPKLVGMIKNNGKYLNGKQPSQQYRIYSANSKGICLNTGKNTSGIYIYRTKNKDVKPSYDVQNNTIIIDGEKYHIDMPDGKYIVRKLTPVEAERLQTLLDNYTYFDGVTDAQRYKMVGNGWCKNVVKWILSHIDLPKDYPIEVLSMYDGIATGRNVLDELGYTNVKYKAYEIDESAIKVALKNYPDIIQCGDAFDLRKSDWMY